MKINRKKITKITKTTKKWSRATRIQLVKEDVDEMHLDPAMVIIRIQTTMMDIMEPHTTTMDTIPMAVEDTVDAVADVEDVVVDDSVNVEEIKRINNLLISNKITVTKPKNPPP